MNKLRKSVFLVLLITVFMAGCSAQKDTISTTEPDSSSDELSGAEENRTWYTAEENKAAVAYLSKQYDIAVDGEVPKVILDTDMTFLGDDAFCLSLLVQADNIGLIDLAGVTITGGNSFVSVGTNATLRQLELWGRPDIPVYIGTDEPIHGFRSLEEQSQLVGTIERWGAMANLDDYVAPEEFHNLGKYFERKWGYSETMPQETSAVDFLVETVLADKNNVTILSVGSPISIALACQQNKEFAQNVKQMIYYGGILGEEGTYTPYADFNCFYDATAFKVCLNADFPKQIMIPHETAAELKISKTVYDLLESKGTTRISEFWISNQGGLYRRDENRTDSCADAAAAVVFLAPSTALTYRNSKVDIIDDVTRAEYGKLVMNNEEEKANVTFITKIDVDKYWDFVTDLLCHVMELQK